MRFSGAILGIFVGERRIEFVLEGVKGRETSEK